MFTILRIELEVHPSDMFVVDIEGVDYHCRYVAHGKVTETIDIALKEFFAKFPKRIAELAMQEPQPEQDKTPRVFHVTGIGSVEAVDVPCK